MHALTDCIKLFLESILLAVKQPGFWKWVILAGVAAAAAFLFSSWSCRMWNRRFVYTVWHRISFVAVSLMAFIAVLVWTASAHLEAAVQRRVEAWKEHLFQRETVTMLEGWKKTLKQIGVPVIPDKTSWFLALPLKTRDYFRNSGRPEGIITLEDLEYSIQSTHEKWEPLYSFPGCEEEGMYFRFSEAIRDFSIMYPFLGTHLDFDFTGEFEDDRAKETFLDYRVTYASRFRLVLDRKTGMRVSRISDRDGADALASAIRNRLVPAQTKWLAEWTRKVGVVIPIVFLSLHLMVSGIVSYLQIRVDHGLPNRRSVGRFPDARSTNGGRKVNAPAKSHSVWIIVSALLISLLAVGIFLRKQGSETAGAMRNEDRVGAGDMGARQPNAKTLSGELTNSLGMRFVPVPGTKILMCIHETRNRDYAAYAAENKGVDMSWKNNEFVLKDVKHKISGDDSNHPAKNISWNDANGFCAWLSLKEGRTYRMPTDHEWSCAVGVAEQEDAGKMPAGTLLKIVDTPNVYPWGNGFPPPGNNLGNYADGSSTEKVMGKVGDLKGYSDGELLTAPVMSYPANSLGLHDLSGNVWEWCRHGISEYYDVNTGKNFPLQDKSTLDKSNVLRGGSYSNSNPEALLSSSRMLSDVNSRNGSFGFRCVAEVPHH